MSYSVENLLNDAIKLSMDLKECEKESEQLIYQSVNLNQDNKNIKEFVEHMNTLGNSNIQPRKSLIASIQCESKKMKELEAENLELKSTLQEYEFVMNLMSKKYRNHISKLINQINVENKLTVNNVINSNYKQTIEEQKQKIENLTDFIQKIMNLDIQNILDIQKSLVKLEMENEGLRQMMGISENPLNHKQNRPTRETAVQTELNDVNNEDLSSNDKMNNLDTSIDMNNTSKLNNLNETNYKDEQINCSTIKKVIKDDHLKLNEQIKP